MGTNVRLSPGLQGVAFELEVDGKKILAIAPASYLERRYGAIDEPKSWLRTYLSCQEEIDNDARAASRDRGRRVVILVDGSDIDDTVPAPLYRL